MKDILDTKSTQELLDSAVAEMAKAANELRCAQGDLQKATNRQKFVLVLLNKLVERTDK